MFAINSVVSLVTFRYIELMMIPPLSRRYKSLNLYSRTSGSDTVAAILARVDWKFIVTMIR